ncbi:hypothetical protein [Sinirhodobacter huangdaonensis]|uniref:Uncharacterized protein n=1 Tax=Paenirhodobacter huangdaonensis TaxID=2501515 RepID=A0A443LXR2_9RHOB|nr:hypothetical protein [Sinirhodobacter huangdaonensis]RWR54031.1 hypothetical protein EOW66_05310 [Sinirhodobacter huangdaonensis]
MPLVNTPRAKQFLSNMGIDAGRRAYLGNPATLPAEPATVVTKLHYVVADAVNRVNNLEFDKTRTPTQQHDAGRQIAEAVDAEITKARASLKRWSDRATDAAMTEIETVLASEAGNSALMSELRSYLRSKAGDAEFQAKLRGLVETDLRFAAAIGSAPAELSGLSSDRAAQLRVYAAAKHAPEASERVQVAQEVAALDAKLASAQAEVAPAFYNAGVQEGMRTAVDVSAPLGGE